ncbi:hypothetical protein MMC25_006968 [Agyrium rufum]|nr:hypothetical protein [Agyrium rufum]
MADSYPPQASIHMNTRHMPSPRSTIYQFPFSEHLDVPELEPPAAAQGPSLLDDNEAFHLNDFFARVSDEPLEYNQLHGDLSNFNVDGGQWYQWSSELPPTFHGSMTSLQAPNTMYGAIPSYGFDGTSDVPPTLSLQETNQFAFEQNNHHHVNQLGLNSLNAQPCPPQVQNGHPVQYADVVFEERTHLNPSGGDGINVLRDIVLGAAQPAPSAPTRTANLQFGSDNGFNNQGYMPPSDQQTLEQVTQNALGKLECLERQPSANTTQANSPAVPHTPLKRSRDQLKVANLPSSTPTLPTNGAQSTALLGNGEALQPAKKRKAVAPPVKREYDDDDDDDDDDEEHQTNNQYSSLARNGNRRSTTGGSARKQSSPGPGGSRASRDNLTEAQKRANHVLSERKRRDLIKQGFDDLSEMVPELRAGGVSKSQMLVLVGDWLEDLVQGNVNLKRQLDELEAQDRYQA